MVRRHRNRLAGRWRHDAGGGATGLKGRLLSDPATTSTQRACCSRHHSPGEHGRKTSHQKRQNDQNKVDTPPDQHGTAVAAAVELGCCGERLNDGLEWWSKDTIPLNLLPYKIDDELKELSNLELDPPGASGVVLWIVSPVT